MALSGAAFSAVLWAVLSESCQACCYCWPSVDELHGAASGTALTQVLWLAVLAVPALLESILPFIVFLGSDSLFYLPAPPRRNDFPAFARNYPIGKFWLLCL